ncbi:hypothetical protein HBH56_209480 [Parastagonospora nodorum]|uniref:F-box domain-containing protein n=1 Tax=Phaeosphaeria nodorum (strain SN15 / ATCC MYA-4574 / FGSC 10173) TaxID=321614 RepID=A0A7U2F6M6_PHANO|nr:hypothetical protein HBH56_209480 [Parastagonospora nodorum]QRC99699.1 hypothetical protein JI435_149820 [Parastagonospora nodorum SN15]KAH3923554.1 hypothetical protein HBH54_208350 [Parastagonospora nodorum]KAH4049923.1 hypothetical protein HBH49_139700 [Parastagonospora nodorum]KAH4129321.1 hypothetical protein HBH45_207260 [Parastagonospora nodorum]
MVIAGLFLPSASFTVHMATLWILPPELLEMILHLMGSIDDVHNMGRTCKKTYDILQRPTRYVKIMRSVIGCAPQHRYDLQLCKMLDLHQDVVQHIHHHNSLLPATQLSPFGYDWNKWESALTTATRAATCDDVCCSDCLPDFIVYDILARYQGLRVLENLWLELQVNANDYFSIDESSDASALSLTHGYQVVINRNELYRDGELPTRKRATPETAGYMTLNSDQRARFYSAVICVWLFNEVRWVLANFQYPGRLDLQIHVLETCKEHIFERNSEPLMDELDQHAVFRFMYHHLLPVYGLSLAEQDISKLPFTFSSDFSKDQGFTARLLQLFFAAGQTYYQPPDLIDLVVRYNASHRPAYPRVAFPTSTQVWQHPSQAFAFPSNPDLDLFDDNYKQLVLRASLTHLNLIARASFHQTSQIRSPLITAPTSTDAYTIRDHASDFFFDRVTVAFEKFESRDSQLLSIREVFPRKWEDALWSVWWWANSEDKARAKMERWREVPVEGLYTTGVATATV